MPPDVVTIVVSTGIGVSVIAGVLSGVCYILAHGVSKKRNRKPVLEWHCFVCGTYLRSRFVDNVTAVICLECEERVCKLRCSKRDYVRRGWICYSCLKQPSLLQGIFSTIYLKYKNFNEPSSNGISINSNHTDEMEKNVEPVQKKEKDHIRDFIEKLVSTILGENVDDASVLRIYSDKYYNMLFEKYHKDLKNAITDLSSTLHVSMGNVPPADQSPSTAHTTLKQTIENLLREVLELPNFKKSVEYQNSSEEKNQTYEELLATAILNKVISKCQRNSAPSSPTNFSKNIDTSPKEYFFGQQTLEINPVDFETTTNSSLNEYIPSDSSTSSGSIKYIDHLSLTIRQRIENVPSAHVNDDIKENLEYFGADTPNLDNYDSNWYLKKRELHESCSPVPVPMLVPNPTSTAKVFIGDKELDETSDLSDALSDYNDTESLDEFQDFMIKTKMIIGSQNSMQHKQSRNLSDEETSVDSGVKEVRDDSSDHRKPIKVKPKADITLDDENVDISLTSLDSNIENDVEYSEKYAYFPKIIFNSSSNQRLLKSNTQQYITFGQDETLLTANNQQISETEPEDMLVLEGSYSKKEKEKWNHPVQLAYNPYSKENIEKRIKSNQRFGRDYYTRQASAPSGKLKNREEEEIDLHTATPRTIDEDIPDDINETFKSTDENETVPITFDNLEDSESLNHFSYDDEKKVYTRVNTELLVYVPEEETEDYSTQIQETVQIEESFPEPKHNESDTITNDTKEENINDNYQLKENEYETSETQNISLCTPKTFTTQKSISKITPKVFAKRVINGTDEIFLENKRPENFSKPPAFGFAKKSDNTLIKKIYANPVVRNFALTSREHIPVALDSGFKSPQNLTSPTKDDEVLNFKLPVKEATGDSLNNHNNNKLISRNHDDQTFSLEFSDNDSFQKQDSLSGDDLTELKGKRIVAGRLGEFSKSFPNLSRIGKPESSTTYREKPPTQIFISVKNLKKLFENNATSSYQKDKPVHSLTARSISKQMKEKLKSETNNDY